MLKRSIGLFTLLLLMVTLLPSEAFSKRVTGTVSIWMNKRNGVVFADAKDYRGGDIISFDSLTTGNFEKIYHACMKPEIDEYGNKGYDFDYDGEKVMDCEIDYKRKGKNFSINWATSIP